MAQLHSLLDFGLEGSESLSDSCALSLIVVASVFLVEEALQLDVSHEELLYLLGHLFVFSVSLSAVHVELELADHAGERLVGEAEVLNLEFASLHSLFVASLDQVVELLEGGSDEAALLGEVCELLLAVEVSLGIEALLELSVSELELLPEGNHLLVLGLDGLLGLGVESLDC